MDSIDSPTLVALAILGGVFLTMFAAIIKSGVEGAIKMWGVMGAVTGVAIGAITSYYFADQAFQSEVQVVQERYNGAVGELSQVKTLAGEYRVRLNSIESSIESNSRITPVERDRILDEIRETESGLRLIEERELRFTPITTIQREAVTNN